MGLRLGRCYKCKQLKIVPSFKIGAPACDDCLAKMGKPKFFPNRGPMKRRRLKKAPTG